MTLDEAKDRAMLEKDAEIAWLIEKLRGYKDASNEIAFAAFIVGFVFGFLIS